MTKKPIEHLGIPPLAGICTLEEACKPGFDVEENVRLLKRYNYVETRMHEIMSAHLACTPEWEVKSAFGLHLWLDAEHSAAFRKRVSEMREPPLHLDKVPDPWLQRLFDELIRSETTVELLVGLYRVVKPALIAAYKWHIRETNQLSDYPTVRILTFQLQEEEKMAEWGAQAIAALANSPERTAAASKWEAHLRAFLVKAGGINGLAKVEEEASVPQPRSDGTPYEMDARPRRDERFTDVYNRSAKFVEVFKDTARNDDERVLALYYKRLKEMDVPEWLAPILYKTKGKPWEYYVDISRQLWDETRHAMMGEVGVSKDGMPFYQYPIDIGSSETLNLDYSPLEAHLLLWGIEQGLMTKDGKQLEWQIGKASGERLAMLFQDYDWADEVLHAQIGRKWLVSEFQSLERMKQQYNELNAKWQQDRAKCGAKSEQRDWWPQFVEEMRKLKGISNPA